MSRHRFGIKGGLHLTQRQAPGLGEGSTWLPGCGVRSELHLVPQVCGIWGGFQDGDLPQRPAHQPPGSSTGTTRVPRSPAHTRLVRAHGTAPPKQQTTLPASFRCATDEKCAKEHLRPSAQTPADPGAHPRVRPSPRRGSGGRGFVRSPAGLPAGRTAPSPSPSPTPAPGAGSAALALRNMEHVARCSVPGRLPRRGSRPATRS